MEFGEQYQDTQATERAQAKLETLKLNMPEIDQYISKFEDLCHMAGYTQGNTEVMHIFFKGLPCSILEETIKGPQDYNSIKRDAVQAIRNKQHIQNILEQHPQSNFSSCFQGNYNNRQPFVNQGEGPPWFQSGAFRRFQNNYNQP
jgi:hypothetical protein